MISIDQAVMSTKSNVNIFSFHPFGRHTGLQNKGIYGLAIDDIHLSIWAKKFPPINFLRLHLIDDTEMESA